MKKSILSLVTIPLMLLCATSVAQMPPAVTPAASPAFDSSGNGLVGHPVSHFTFLTLVTGYLVVTLIGLFGFVILWRMFTGKIDISLLISEADGVASLSRFQFLIFTFVISLSLLLVILGKQGGPDFPPTIPAGIYALLGISAASYVVSKGIQSGADKARDDNDRVSPDNENAG